MSEDTSTAEWVLPEDVATMLRDAYSAYREKVTARASGKDKDGALRELAIIAKAGREKGWPYTEMANACDMTPERLRQIVATLDADESEPSEELRGMYPQYAPHPDRRKPRTRRSRKPKRSTLTDDERATLGRLAPEARRTSGSTPLGSPLREATVELSKLIIKLHDRGVIWRDLAEATGLSEGGVRARAARHGYHDGPPPSIPRYRGTTIYRESKRKRRESGQPKAKSNAA